MSSQMFYVKKRNQLWQEYVKNHQAFSVLCLGNILEQPFLIISNTLPY